MFIKKTKAGKTKLIKKVTPKASIYVKREVTSTTGDFVRPTVRLYVCHYFPYDS